MKANISIKVTIDAAKVITALTGLVVAVTTLIQYL